MDKQKRFVYSDIERCTSIDRKYLHLYIDRKQKDKNIYTNRLTSNFTSFYLWHTFSLGPVVRRLLQKRLCRVIPFPGGTVYGGGVLSSSVFGWGSFLPKAFFHRQLLCRIRDCQRRRHSLIWEGYFVKGVSYPVAVVTGELVPGAFGSGCAVLCELSKRSKYM